MELRADGTLRFDGPAVALVNQKVNLKDLGRKPIARSVVKVEGMGSVEALFDTGAVVGMVDRSWYESFSRRPILKSTNCKVVGCNRQGQMAAGETTLRISFPGGKTDEVFEYAVLVVDGALEKFLIGEDFLCSLGAMIDMGRKSIYFPRQKMSIKMASGVPW